MKGQTTWNGYTTLKSLFKVFHRARQAGVFEDKRLVRGLGIAMRKATVEHKRDGSRWFESPGSEGPHRFGVKICDCEDSRSTKYCKHKIAAMLLDKARKEDKES